MKEYFYVLLVTSVCGTLCTVLASGGFEKYIKYIVSLICLGIMILPFKNFDFSEIVSTENINIDADHTQAENRFYQTTLALTTADAENYICQIVFNEFGINPNGCHIEIDWEENEAVIKNITLIMDKSHNQKSPIVKDYLKTVLGGEVNIDEE